MRVLVHKQGVGSERSRQTAIEAAQACRDYAFTKTEAARLVKLIGPASTAARRVAEDLGMTLDSQTVQWNVPVAVYAITRHV